MKELLKRWHELEPDRCYRRPAGTYGPHFSTGHTSIPERTQDIDDEVKALLQLDVEQAIEAQGWRWGRNPIGSTYHIIIPKGGFSSRYWEWIEGHDNLLSAYIQALESIQS